jgi:hypothetical protein
MNRKLVWLLAGLAVMAWSAPALGKATSTLGPVSGTWTYTDSTPDPTLDADTSHHCTNPATHANGQTTPPAPTDVNVQELKVKKRGTLSLTGHVSGDWAVEVLNKKNVSIAGADVNPPESETLVTTLPRKGTYKVMWCNLSGEPQITVDYTFQY